MLRYMCVCCVCLLRNMRGTFSCEPTPGEFLFPKSNIWGLGLILSHSQVDCGLYGTKVLRSYALVPVRYWRYIVETVTWRYASTSWWRCATRTGSGKTSSCGRTGSDTGCSRRSSRPHPPLTASEARRRNAQHVHVPPELLGCVTSRKQHFLDLRKY